jgi:hypothetical protein
MAVLFGRLRDDWCVWDLERDLPHLFLEHARGKSCVSITVPKDTGKFLTDEEFKALAVAVNDPTRKAFLPVESMDFPAQFTIALGRCHVRVEEIREVKLKCRDYLTKLCIELCNRLPDCLSLYQAVAYLTPTEALKAEQRRNFFDLPWNLAGKYNLRCE